MTAPSVAFYGGVSIGFLFDRDRRMTVTIYGNGDMLDVEQQRALVDWLTQFAANAAVKEDVDAD